MIVLGIETTAHTFGVSIYDDSKEGTARILSNAKDAYSTPSGGMIPGKLSDHHVEVFDLVLEKALNLSGIPLEKIDLIAFSQSPGLGNALRIGASVARALSLKLGKPLIGVNHCIAHLEIGRLLTNAKDPILLYASGANTQIIAYDAGKYRIFGETLDVGVGNFLDTFGRLLGLGFPAGPKIEELASKGVEYVPLPYSVKGMDVSFSGMLTRLRKMLKETKDDGSPLYRKEDLCFSVQETAFAMLVEVTERAMAHCGKKEVILGGGVACNKRLQEMCKIMCEEREATSYCPANQFLVDNAAMIAHLGWLEYTKGNVRTSFDESVVDPYLRTDDVLVTWR
jgi:N6-L-threonylcarbamoyladenine synthase